MSDTIYANVEAEPHAIAVAASLLMRFATEPNRYCGQLPMTLDLAYAAMSHVRSPNVRTDAVYIEHDGRLDRITLSGERLKVETRPL